MPQPEIERVELGSSGLEVSELAIGTYKVLNKIGAVATSEMLAEAYSLGINFIDTSDNYTDMEGIIGTAIRTKKLPKDDLVIATKTGLARSQKEANAFGSDSDEYGTSPERIRRQVENSLYLLGVDAIDLYQLHTYEEGVEPVEIVEVMNELIKDGKIRHWGLSNYVTPEQVVAIDGVCESTGSIKPVSLQNFNTLINQPYAQAITTAQDLGMGILAHSPLHGGALTDKYVDRLTPRYADRRDPFSATGKSKLFFDHLETLREYAHDHGGNLQQLAVAWLMSQELTVPIIGPCNSDQLKDIAQSASFSIDAEGFRLISLAQSEFDSI